VPASASRELLIDADRHQFAVKPLESHQCVPVLLLSEPIQTPGGRKGRPSLSVREDARGR
jgi:hypothetical protein